VGSTQAIVFFSWQSDIRAAACRSLILQALEEAARAISNDKSIAVEPVIDRDTQNVPGAPDIGATILSKIDAAAVFVADVTIVGQANSGKPTPNPNVLIELGYALKTLGWPRILLVQNTAFGQPEALPFDLRQKRVVAFSSPENANERAAERRTLQKTLEVALASILKAGATPSAEMEFTLAHKRDTTQQEYHHYEIVPALKNVGARRVDDWQIELEFPKAFLDGVVHGLRVEDRSTATHALFQLDGRHRGAEKPLFPGQTGRFSIGYQVTTALYRDQRHLFDATVHARALVDGEVVADVSTPFRELQEF
jgi:hypothetical protein